ncbi:multicopper oxidase type 3 [Gemmatirosa kalamazoonensis]|uniref:Multicopper oxidase type 3 n=1 Tax=Gemmatirosa kalamazoonensis TaxID=861299 RepID=W0RIM9_9BACT|nr:multicopper oxidase domain-containing protein [Gemmatirosa kalamazoonensis]AHG90287.1 multicopper oxidase type 3 [Gemmatirosa kalamazoonensis]
MTWFAPLLAAIILSAAKDPPSRSAPVALPNDNRVPAGVTVAGVRRIRLVVQRAVWHPDADDGPSLVTEVLGEEGKTPMIPAPLIRVLVGTRVDATVRNTLADTIVFFAQCGIDCRDSLFVAPGQTRALPVRTSRPGTYSYASFLYRGGHPYFESAAATQTGGAIVVDSAGAPPDRVFVIAEWIQRFDTTKVGDDERLVMTINGRMWPHTERLHLTVGDTVHWRIVDASGDTHPMHLHGFYFRVDSRGDGATDTIYSAAQRRWAVTEEPPRLGAFTLTWVPQRSGNWIFHCHKAVHMGGFQHAHLAEERVDPIRDTTHDAHTTDAEHIASGMGGLVLGIEVAPRPSAVPAAIAVSSTAPPAPVAPRRIRLLAQRLPGALGVHGYVVQGGDSAPARDSVRVPGPPIVLTRGEPVEITVVNHLDVKTGVHWHGIELDSYYDGVGGWSGAGAHLAPRIAPNDSFVVRFTPPRAGTFMYHTHNDEVRQLVLGLYGPLVVLEPGQTFDASTDHLVVIGETMSSGRRVVGVNGAAGARPMHLAAGKPHRFRLLNVLIDDDAEVSLVDSANAPLVWRAVAKDGADLPVAQRTERPARLSLGPGETVDVEIVPKPGRYALLVRGYSNVLIDVDVR